LPVEDAGDFGVRVVHGQAAQQVDDVLVGADVGLGAAQRHGQLADGAASPPQDQIGVRVWLLAVHGDVDLGQQGAQQLFTVLVGGAWRGPYLAEVVAEGEDCLFLLRWQRFRACGLAAGEFGLGVGQVLQGGVPLGFQATGDEAVVWVDGPVAAFCLAGQEAGLFGLASPLCQGDDGRTFFTRLLRRFTAAGRCLAGEAVRHPAHFVAFDVLQHACGRELLDQPLTQRRHRLQRLLASAPPPVKLYPQTDDEMVARHGPRAGRYLLMCEREGVDPVAANRVHSVSTFVSDIAAASSGREAGGNRLGIGLASATIRQGLVPVHLFSDFLMEEGMRESQPGGPGPLHQGAPGVRFGSAVLVVSTRNTGRPGEDNAGLTRTGR
jgi:hypothetical protein